jgi:hypothetical protein
MIARRWWVRLRHGVYTDSATLDAAAAIPRRRHLLDCAAAVHALPLATFAFAQTAALVHDLPLPNGIVDDVELVRNRGTDVRALHRRITTTTPLPSVHVRSHDLSSEPCSAIGGIPTVSRELAALSTAAHCDREWAVAILDAAAWQSPEAVARLSYLAADWPYLRGIGTVRSALPSVRTGAQTPIESISRIRLTDRGVPEPELQFALRDRQGLIGYADMAWLALGVIGEADGLLKYGTRDDVIREKLREDRIRALGYSVVRWTWDEMIRDSDAIVARIMQARQLARRRVG